ncbi:unnamed protein product [Ixodes persulcatus]
MYVNIYTNVTDYPGESQPPAEATQEECNVCGEAHATSGCPLLGLAQKVDDKCVPSRARLSLPPNLALDEAPDGSPRVTAREAIPVGTQFGPVEAPRYRAFKGAPRFRLKVFPTKGRATCLDTSDEYQCNWMCFVEPAPEASLQNLIAYQLGQDIYFSVQKPIDCGDVLLVGYAPPYGRKMAGPAEEPAPPPPPPVAEQPGVPPVKRKRGRPPRSASAPRNTTVTIIPQAIAPPCFILVLVIIHTADGTVACYDRQQWTCSQCGRLYRDSVVFARHLQDHYRPVYLRELAGRQRGGGRGARRGRGRPRGQGWSRPFAPPRRSSSPAGAIEEEDEEAVEIGEDTQQVADPDAALEQGGEVPAAPAEAPIEESQLGALLEEKEGTRLLIQLEDGTIHEITSYPSNLNLPTLGEHDEVHLTEDASNSTSEPTVTLATLDQLSLQRFHQDTVPQQVVSAGKLKDLLLILILLVTIAFIACQAMRSASLSASCTRIAMMSERRALIDNTTDDAADNATDDATDDAADDATDDKTDGAPVPGCQKGTQAQGRGDRPVHCGKAACAAMHLGYCFNKMVSWASWLTLYTMGKTAQKTRTTKRNKHDSIIFLTSLFSPSGIAFPQYSNARVEQHLFKVLLARVGVSCISHARQSSFCSCGKNRTEAVTNISWGCSAVLTCQKYEVTLQRIVFTSLLLLYRNIMKTAQTMKAKAIRTLRTIMMVVTWCLLAIMTRSRPILSTHHSFQSANNSMSFWRHCNPYARSKQTCAPHRLKRWKPVPCLLPHSFKRECSCLEAGQHPPYYRTRRCRSFEKRRFRSDCSERTPRRSRDAHIPSGPDKPGHQQLAASARPVPRNLHGEKRFQCDVCGKRFHRKDLLLEHHAVHGDPTFPCPTCRKLFKTKKSLDVHMMIHSGVKRFKCSVCSKASGSLPRPEFFQKGNLQKHEDTHLSERRHRCTVCQKVFTTRESLGRHMLEHTRGRVFTCGICGRAFVKEHQLRNHHRMFHSNQAYTCHYCGLCLKLRHSLKRHLRKKHPEQESQWRNPEVLNNMLVLKGDAGVAAAEAADPGLDPGAAVEGLRRASVVGDGNLGSGGLEAVFEGADAIAAVESAREIAESLVANVMTEQGSEVLLAVEGFSSEELREAIATGRAQIKQGPTPDTIEISMPFEVTEGAGEQVTYMANLVDAPDHLVADGSADLAADTVGLQTTTAEVGAEQFVVSGMAEAQAGEEAAAQGQYITVPMYGMEDRAAPGQERPLTESTPATQEALLASVAEGIPYEEPRFVVARQEVTDGAQVVYETGRLPDQTMSHGAILLDDGTILQQEEQQEGPTDLLFYVLATSASQEDG